MSSYTYDVPQLSDFTDNISNENYAEIESYFDISHENCNGGVFTQVFTVDAHNSLTDDSEGSDRDPLGTSLRRSSSVGDLQTFIRNTQVNERQSHLPKDADGTSFYRSNSTISLLQSKKFVSVAEAISTFHNKTPDRFHSRSRMLKPSFAPGAGLKQCTIPASPFLATKRRARPTTVLSHDEKEIREAEEMNKFKIKANPLNPKVLARPATPKVGPVRKSTVPQPFNITEVSKRKPVIPVSNVTNFHAQPMPKFLLKAPLVKPQTPIIMKRGVEKLKPEVNVKKPEDVKLKNTVPLPFSFLERDKALLRKKDEALKKLLENEKRNREFHAKPLPKYITAADGGNTTLLKRNTSANVSKHSSTESLVQSIFKAKPAKVLNMKPFEPKKEERVLEVAEFRLNTDSRAKEREAFQSKLKEKEHLLHEYLKRKEEETHQKEEEEVRRLRKQTEYRAQPIRKYKDVGEIEHKKLTIPVSPKFRRNHSNKENLSS